MKRKPVDPFMYEGMRVTQERVGALLFENEYNYWKMRYSNQFFTVHLEAPYWSWECDNEYYVVQGVPVHVHVNWLFQYVNFNDRYSRITKYQGGFYEYHRLPAEDALMDWLMNDFVNLMIDIDEYISTNQFKRK